jgi:hypothetical protein
MKLTTGRIGRRGGRRKIFERVRSKIAHAQSGKLLKEKISKKDGNIDIRKYIDCSLARPACLILVE